MTPTVTVVTSVHQPDDPRIRLKGIQTLVDAGWRVTYVAPAPGPANSEGIDVIPLEGSRIRRTLAAARTMFALDSDVTVVHDPELLPAAMALGTRRGADRVVFDLHEDLPRQLLTRRSSPPFLRKPSAVASMWALRAAERLLTVTLAESNYSWVFERDHPVFENHPVASSLPMRVDDPSGVVYVGDITADRGIPLLVEAMGEHSGVPLTLIGRCSPALRHELEARALALDVPLEMAGFLPYAEAWARAARHVVGVSPLLDLPNYRASLPTKIDEYRAVGLVTVVSDLPASLEAINGSTAAISFTAGDTNALAGALGEALGDPGRLAAAAAEAPEVRASRVWDSDRFADFYASRLTAAQ